MVWLWAAIGIAVIIITVLIMKIYLLKKSAAEMETAFSESLQTDTNVLIDISSRDKHMRSLAAGINKQLRMLRKERHRFQQGDTELKNAVTNISHDLRTPLTAICGYLDLLETQEKSEEAERYLTIIRERCTLLTQLTEELFRYSVILTSGEELKTENILMNNVLEESVAAFYATLVAHKIMPEIVLPEKKVICRADYAAVLRIFSNLLSNAVKYSSGDLNITLKETGEILFENTADGLDKVQASRLFDRFYTVEAARHSTGLGLSITRALAKQMGGNVLAVYHNGKLRVSVLLPLAENALH